MIIPIELRFKADKDSKSAFRTDKTIKSHDVNSVEFHITVDGLELTDTHTAKILSVFHSSTRQVNVECEIVNGKIIYKPDTNLISRHEHVTNYVYVYNGNQSLDVREFIYTVDLSKIDETSLEVKEVYDQSYADLLADFEQALEDYKLTLPQADSVRADIDEILNQFSEDSQAKLNQYDDDAQQVITDNQTAFDLAETGRQDSYVQAESERNQLSSQAVVDWEQGADALLETAEGNESVRVVAEASRVEKESERVQAETERIQAEQARKEAETLREESYEQKVDTALVEADIVEKVDNKVTELTPMMNDLTAQLAQKANHITTQNSLDSKRDKSTPIGLNDTDSDLLNAIQNGSGTPVEVLSIPRPDSVTPSTLSVDTSAILEESPIKVEYGVNLFNKDTALHNTLLDEANIGELITSTGWQTSDLIPVDPNTILSFSSPRRILAYDKFKQPIINSFVDNSTSDSKTLTTSNEARYIRFSSRMSALDIFQLKVGEETTRRYPHSGKVILKPKVGKEIYVDNVVNNRYETKPIGNQLFDVKTVFIDSSLTLGGTLNTNSIGWNTSDFIEVNQDKVVISSVRSVHQYDKYKEPIPDTYSNLGGSGVVNNQTLTLHHNAKYIRFTYYYSSNVMVNHGDTPLPHEEIKYGLFIDGKLVHNLETSTQDTSTSLPSQDLSKIDHSKVTLGQLNIISSFDDGTWVQKTGSNMETSTTYTRGKSSIKTTSVNRVSESISKAVDLNLKDKVLYLNVYIEDVTKLSMLQFFFGSTGIPDYYGWYPPISTFKNGWNTVTITTNSFSPKNESTNPDLLENVKEVRIMNLSKDGESSAVIFDNLSYVDSAISRGKIVLQFDDQWDGTWKYAKPIMDKYGMRGVIYVIKNLVGRDQFMTFDQLKTCYEQGWDLGTHGQVELTTLTTPEAIRSELLKNYDYLMDNGFVRSACHYCTPAGKYNDMSLIEIKKLFKTHRTTKFGYNTLPTNNKYELFNISGNESELPFLKAVLDNTEKNKTLTIMNWHQIVEVATGNESMTPGLKSTFEDFINYLSTKNIDVVTLSDVFNPLD